MIAREYAERTVQDIETRATTVRLNQETALDIRETRVEELMIHVETDSIYDIDFIEQVELLDENGAVMIERRPMLEVSDNQALEFRFSIEVVR